MVNAAPYQQPQQQPPPTVVDLASTDDAPSVTESTSLEQKVSILESMGFGDVARIRRSLADANNDINEAVALLTNEKQAPLAPPPPPPPPPHTLRSHQALPNPPLANTNTNNFGDDVIMLPVDVQPSSSSSSSSSSASSSTSASASSSAVATFPYDQLLELEANVFTDNWSIPYKRDELLDRLLHACMRCLRAQTAHTDEACKRFVERVLPDVYRKLLDSGPVSKWAHDIQVRSHSLSHTHTHTHTHTHA